jgi:hypothetical protein
VLVPSFGAPDGAQFRLPRLGLAVLLLAGAAFELLVAHGYAGAVHAQVERWRQGLARTRLVDHPLLVLRHLAAQGLRRSLDVLGCHPNAGELPQQLFALCKADPRRDQTRHPQHGW